jgi:hypothetical protein
MKSTVPVTDRHHPTAYQPHKICKIQLPEDFRIACCALAGSASAATNGSTELGCASTVMRITIR